MQHNKIVACAVAVVLALAMACSKNSNTPVSPSAALPGAGDAAPDGSTLKVTAPTPVSPVNGAQPDTVVLVATKAQGKFTGFPVSYQFQIRSGSNVVFDSGVVGGAGNGPDQVAYTPTVALTPDATYTWRARGAYAGAYGPWSSDATFKAPVGGYIRGSELFDPLTGGRTVGELNGGATLTADGVYMPTQDAYVRYVLAQTLPAGEFSAMIKGLSSKTPGAKSKVMSMQEGFSDITTNDYRATMDFRGKNYPSPGAVTCRFITGDARSRIFDCPRQNSDYNADTWYFWRLSWQTGSTTLEVRQDSETGPVKYLQTIRTGSHDYRPDPHVLYLGQPAGRGGVIDATAGRITIKNVWASSRPRPPFPG